MSQRWHQQENREISIIGSECEWQHENGKISLNGSERERQQVNRNNSDIEKQFGGQDNGVYSINKILHPKGAFMFKWNAMFLLSCVLAVQCVDPWFLYLLVINQDDKCLALDRRLMITAVCFRSVFDMIYVANIITGYFRRRFGLTDEVTDARVIIKNYLRSYEFAIDIFAILPIPQVFVPIIFSKMTRSKFLDMKILNLFVILQYVPRVLRIYLSWGKHFKSSRKLSKRVWATFNIFQYILASNVLGGLWYFFSIQREMICWHAACEKHAGCSSSFRCGHNFGNYTFLDANCPIHTPNATLVNFGIFYEALQSGTVSSRHVPQKILHCFWWGLRNLSSFGQNLETSTYFLENCFTVFISIYGLLLFLYFIGNAQTYMQMGTEKAAKKAEMEAKKAKMKAKKAAEKAEKIRCKMESIRSKIESWTTRNQLSYDMKERIINYIQQRLEENKDFDLEKPVSHLSKELTTEIKHHLCLPLLKKVVPNLESHGEKLLEWICESLKPKYYNEDIYILREGEPLTVMLFITQGSVLCFETSSGENGEGTVADGADQSNEKFELYGEELLEWRFNRPPSHQKRVPTSTKTVKTQSKVEAFALTANDLKSLVPMHARAASSAKDFVQGVFRHL